MRRRSVPSLVLGLTLAVAGCDGGTNQQVDAAVQEDAPPQFDRTPGDAPPGDVLPDGAGGNHSFETAEAIAVSSTSTPGVISAPGNVDYYKFEGTAGDWIHIHTEAATLIPASSCDTVITLYDQAQVKLANDDDARPALNNDSEIIYLLKATGTYYVTVQDLTSWKVGQVPAGGSTYKYSLTVARIDVNKQGVVHDTEPNDTAAQAQAMTYYPAGSTDSRAALIIGAFETQDDVAVFAFNVPEHDGGVAERNMSFDLMPWGNDAVDGNAYGSTTPLGEVSVTDPTGATTIARIDNAPTDATTKLAPALAPGDYLLWVKHPATALGSNDFFVIKVQLRTENPPEAEAPGATGANDTPGTAEALAPLDLGSGRRGYFVLAHLIPADVDYFSFSVNAGERVSVSCGAARSGSGLRWLEASLRNASDAVLSGGTVTDALSQDLRLSDITTGGTGTYYLRLQSSGQASGVTGDFARCAVYPAVP
ncbi:MAG: PPC domain-containing protein [Deltaproteobacteria bacterium]|nr:PPC domain-containing protein [Deltaproteobacteria bacterium]